MNNKKWIFTLSSFLISIGFCLLVLSISAYVYGRFEAWAASQPRALVSNQVIWPEVPPVTPLPSPTPMSSPTSTPMPTSTPTPTPTSTPTPTPLPSIQIEIPKIDIERSIVPVSKVIRDEQLEWDTEPLFATQNRPDLVGHLEGTANPGQPGNIVLVGHNYNLGYYDWIGVFYRLSSLEKGDVIHLLTEDDHLFVYEVEQVDEVTYQTGPTADMLAHIFHLSPTQGETLTLATCGGANFAPFPSRIYVTAKRVTTEE